MKLTIRLFLKMNNKQSTNNISFYLCKRSNLIYVAIRKRKVRSSSKKWSLTQAADYKSYRIESRIKLLIDKKMRLEKTGQIKSPEKKEKKPPKKSLSGEY